MWEGRRTTEAFAAVLREKRTELGVSQEKLSIAAELDRTFVSKIERSGRNPTLESVFKIAAALHVPPEELIREVRERAEALESSGSSPDGAWNE